MFPLGQGGNYYRQRGPGQPPPEDDDNTEEESYGGRKNGDTSGRRKKKATQDDEDYQPATRRSSRRTSSKTKQQQRPPSPPGHARQLTPEPYIPTEEERRLASSDLDDCEEVWLGELADYMVETRKRQKQVGTWFEISCVERNNEIARMMSQHYASRLATMPPPPPIPMYPLVVPADNRHSAIHERSPSVVSVDEFESLDGDEWDQSSHRHAHSQDDFNSAEDAARALEDFALGRGGLPVGAKRPAAGPFSDSGSDLEVPVRKSHSRKRRRLGVSGEDIAAELERAADQLTPYDQPYLPGHAPSISAMGKGKNKQIPADQRSVDSATSTPRGHRGKKKKTFPPHTQDGLMEPSASTSASRGGTPSASGPASPALTASTLLELDEPIPAMKKARKADHATLLKRVKALEESQRKVWLTIARKDVVKVYRYHALGYQARQAQHKRLATLASIQARRPFTKTPRNAKDVQSRGKRLMREMLISWKKNEKEERDWRKRQLKEDLDRQKMEEEKREAARQARKLEFLISQTELYSHFVGSKLKTAEIEGEDALAANAPPGADYLRTPSGSLKEIDFDDDDETNLYNHASRNAQEALALAKAKAQQFDSQAALERKTNQALKLAKGQAHVREDSESPSASGAATTSATPLVDLDSDELNFQNPTSLGELTIQQPAMLMAQLKEYQLKGLNWLATLYEQGINGILADEMGLGKTVQSISLLAYLAEKHDIWGPFLVVSPASTLHNWQQELTRFVPNLKALPYWGTVKDRATLRKVWSKKDISYDKDAPFHVLITSYQLITQDQQYFQRLKWQYMILDEAQNIKNSASVRWKTLLGMNCRNRLLLTGTPIQNSMQELWALLHFIMPSLFDSHDEFNEWFSKDIEGAAEGKGSRLSEHQLRRLHMILKPFMLRRVKRHVQNELSEKIEKDIYVDLSARQRSLYRALLSNVSVTELLERAANIGDPDSARSLMNLVMQFRKVCNHPELFERADVIAPFSFAEFGRSGPLNRDGDFVHLAYSTRNPIEYKLPNLFYREGGLVGIPAEDSHPHFQRGSLHRLMNIWDTERIYHSLVADNDSSFAFLRLLNTSPGEVHKICVSPLIRRHLSATIERAEQAQDTSWLESTCSDILEAGHFTPLLNDVLLEGFPALRRISTTIWNESPLSRAIMRLYVPPAVAPPISVHCTDRSFLEHQSRVLDAPLASLALYGLPPTLVNSENATEIYQELLPGAPVTGLLASSGDDQLPMSVMQVPDAKRLIYDSAKLARLDSLLQELKAGDHRVLIYSQMTRMLDLMEEYLVFRQHKYLRLDGSSKLEDRRDMVIEWQTRPDIFVFLLSTRAGGLGINLTAADTVIFYDHDWNPSNDAQAMDRAHRLGQTRQVTVYRLITKGTIDERIVQLARVKKDVQDIVVGNKNLTDVTKPSDIVSLLLNDDQLANLESSAKRSARNLGKQPADAGANAVNDIWNDEGDEFFSNQKGAQEVGAALESVVEDTGAVPTKGRKRGQKRDPNAPRRKPGPKPGTRRKRDTGGTNTPLANS
ncbi:hypothetical protein PUNSTDRAFT_117740 [Punctularia strigosozonata HHB-11173 SS5]|uniref:uncharacterized protein n=1 Tax=Punctularia strigosozonata (strain HHB-11173) TaxID=741275 RepID=UPI00044172F3|nr:uncharacterized protein PUNSTDRAFT_117740 [Punctularia strigosozonata HHB-11173 SS5]EIN14169.1 hypothetical protein PUNSTDRAFT_117740 [Punctularia strigosozonata HHB-11173 SS5]